MTHFDPAVPPFNTRVAPPLPAAERCGAIAAAMERVGLLETPPPPAAIRWVETFIEAFGDRLETAGDAVPLVRELRAEAVTIPALDLEKLRSRQVLFFLDTVSQYVDDQPELRGLALRHDLVEIADEFGLSPDDALWAVRVALTARSDGPPLELLFPLLGHDRIMMRIGAVNSHLLHGRGLEPIKYGPDGEPFHPLGHSKR
jgi:Anticodon binding domain